MQNKLHHKVIYMNNKIDIDNDINDDIYVSASFFLDVI
jgi:hypothetical protein